MNGENDLENGGFQIRRPKWIFSKTASYRIGVNDWKRCLSASVVLETYQDGASRSEKDDFRASGPYFRSFNGVSANLPAAGPPQSPLLLYET